MRNKVTKVNRRMSALDKQQAAYYASGEFKAANAAVRNYRRLARYSKKVG